MRSPLIIALLLVSGCSAGLAWHRPNTTRAQFEQDKAQCRYEAVAATRGIRSGMEQGLEETRLEHLCLEARGYYKRAAY